MLSDATLPRTPNLQYLKTPSILTTLLWHRYWNLLQALGSDHAGPFKAHLESLYQGLCALVVAGFGGDLTVDLPAIDDVNIWKRLLSTYGIIWSRCDLLLSCVVSKVPN